MIGLTALKGALCGVVIGVVWRSRRLGILCGLALAQIGEFSFILAREGTAAGVLPASHEQALLAAAIVTMAATPFLLQLGRRLALVGAQAPGERGPLRDHVLVIGYGTTGQAVARVLKETGISFVAVDMVAPVVEAARAERLPVRFGDASRRAVGGAAPPGRAAVGRRRSAATRASWRCSEAEPARPIVAPNGLRDRESSAWARRGGAVGVLELDRAFSRLPQLGLPSNVVRCRRR